MLFGYPCRGSGDLVAKGTKRGGAGDVSLVGRLQLRGEPVRAIEGVLKVRAPHEPDALALVLKSRPVRLELTIWKEVLELNETGRPAVPLRIVVRSGHLRPKRGLDDRLRIGQFALAADPRQPSQRPFGNEHLEAIGDVPNVADGSRCDRRAVGLWA
jgi:hypothetical protein